MTTFAIDGWRAFASRALFARMNPHALLAATLITVILAPVGTQPVNAQSIRDSSRIRIVTNERPVWPTADALRLATSPSLVIGDRPGEPYELSRVIGAVRLTDGTIVLGHGSSLELRFYDSTGKYLKPVGRRGQGPGEFSRMESLTRLPGDTLAVSDGNTVSLFTADGTFIRAINARVPPIQQLRGFTMVLGAFSDGTRFVTAGTNPAPRDRGERWVVSMPLLIVNSENSVTHDLGQVPWMQFAMDNQPQRPWFGAQATFTNDGQRFYFGMGDEYSIRSYTRDGRLSRIIQRRWTPPKVTDADIDAFVVEWGKRWIKSTGDSAAKQRADLRDDPYASTVPAYSQFVVDDTGRLWVREPRVADAAWAGQLSGTPLVASTWNVFDQEGRWLCNLTMPARFLVKAIGPDYVIGVSRGLDDVETVTLYRLTGGRRIP